MSCGKPHHHIALTASLALGVDIESCGACILIYLFIYLCLLVQYEYSVWPVVSMLCDFRSFCSDKMWISFFSRSLLVGYRSFILRASSAANFVVAHFLLVLEQIYLIWCLDLIKSASNIQLMRLIRAYLLHALLSHTPARSHRLQLLPFLFWKFMLSFVISYVHIHAIVFAFCGGHASLCVVWEFIFIMLLALNPSILNWLIKQHIRTA